TSLVLADRPELGDRARAAELPWVPVNLGASLRAGMRTFVEMGLPQAYAGTPATATPEEGAATFDRLAGMLVATMRELVAGTGGRDRPAGGAPGGRSCGRVRGAAGASAARDPGSAVAPAPAPAAAPP